MGILGAILGWFNPLKPLIDSVIRAQRDIELAKSDRERVAAEERLSWAKTQAEVQISAMQHDSWFSPRNLIAYAVAIYVIKLFVWDTVAGLGVTDNPGDIVNWIAAEVIAALFISKTAQTVAGSFAAVISRRAGGK